LFGWYEPDGGCVFYPRYLGADGVESFCKRLIEGAGILLVPASVYSSSLLPLPTDRFRVGFAREGMREALADLEQFLVG